MERKGGEHYKLQGSMPAHKYIEIAGSFFNQVMCAFIVIHLEVQNFRLFKWDIGGIEGVGGGGMRRQTDYTTFGAKKITSAGCCMARN